LNQSGYKILGVWRLFFAHTHSRFSGIFIVDLTPSPKKEISYGHKPPLGLMSIVISDLRIIIVLVSKAADGAIGAGMRFFLRSAPLQWRMRR